MTQEEIKKEISHLDEKLGYLIHYYHEVRETIKQLDVEIMENLNRKWYLERKIVTVVTCPVKRPSSRPKEQEILKAESLTEEQCRELLRLLEADK